MFSLSFSFFLPPLELYDEIPFASLFFVRERPRVPSSFVLTLYPSLLRFHFSRLLQMAAGLPKPGKSPAPNPYGIKILNNAEVCVSTAFFSERNVVSKDEHWVTFKGTLSGASVLVHRMSNFTAEHKRQLGSKIHSLKHPHIAEIMGWCPDDMCVVTKYLENGSLERKLVQGDLHWTYRVLIAAEIASAVVHLESKNVPLYAFSSAFVFLDDSNRSKLVYTLPWMFRKDFVHSFSIFLVELLTGLPPEEASSLTHSLSSLSSSLASVALLKKLDFRSGSWPADIAKALVNLTIQSSYEAGHVNYKEIKFIELHEALVRIEQEAMDSSVEREMLPIPSPDLTSDSETLPDVETKEVLDSEVDVLHGLPLEERLSAIRSEVQDRASALHAEACSLRISYQLAVKKRREATRKMLDIAEKVKDCELQISKACDEDDFTAAENWSQIIDSEQKEARAADAEAREAEEECPKILQRLQEVEQEKIAVKVNAAVPLLRLQQDAREHSEKVEEKNLADAIARLKLLVHEQDEMKLKSRDVMLKQQKLDKEMAELQKAQKAATAVKISELREFEKERKELLRSQEEIEQKVAAKLLEIEAQEDKISAIDLEVQAAEREYESLRSAMNSEQEKIASAKIEVENEHKKLEKEKLQMLTLKEKGEESLKKMMKVAETALQMSDKLKRESEERKAKNVTAEKLRQMMRKLSEEEREARRKWPGALKQTWSIKRNLQNLDVQWNSIQEDMLNRQKDLEKCEERLVLLKADKTSAISSKLFVQAKEISNEVKRLSDEISTKDDELVGLNATLASVDTKRNSEAANLAASEETLMNIEQHMFKARFEWLKIVATVTRQKIEGMTEIGEIDKADALRQELREVDEEVDDLRKRYGL